VDRVFLMESGEEKFFEVHYWWFKVASDSEETNSMGFWDHDEGLKEIQKEA
jgi:hypothetical protein